MNKKDKEIFKILKKEDERIYKIALEAYNDIYSDDFRDLPLYEKLTAEQMANLFIKEVRKGMLKEMIRPKIIYGGWSKCTEEEIKDFERMLPIFEKSFR